MPPPLITVVSSMLIEVKVSGYDIMPLRKVTVMSQKMAGFVLTSGLRGSVLGGIGVGSAGGGGEGATRPPKFQVGGASPPQLYPLFT